MSGEHTECAIYLAQGPELRILWANDSYLALLDEPFRSGSAIGMRLDEVSPLATMRAQMLQEVMRTGEPQSGEDRRFSAKDGTLVLDWRAYRPIPDHVLVVIVGWRAGDDDGE